MEGMDAERQHPELRENVIPPKLTPRNYVPIPRVFLEPAANAGEYHHA